ncbi:MAG: diguanylate cyclase [Azoarcus sp.]|nr:diguanylate cyclase [Azoarcus sp.]
MDSFQWNEYFVTGIEEVDTQHMELVRIINRLGEILSNSAAPDATALIGLIDELSDYARFHFAAEEVFMAAAGIDPRHLQAQAHEHEGFINEVTRFGLTTMTPATSSSLLSFLIHWLAYHILGSDQSMARQRTLILQGHSADEAYREDARLGTRATEPLLAALNGLFSQVSERNRELQELNRTLEAKVAERTRELAIANRNLEALSMTDVLTGLPNRRHAMRRLDLESAESGQVLSLMMIDADGFKAINDTWGHDAGDVVLRALAATLADAVRTDDLVCRLGGDEFLVICPRTPLGGAMQLAETMRAKVSSMRVSAGAGEWRGSVSIGVAERTAAMSGTDALMRSADEGVYLAKRNGRNCVATCQDRDRLRGT